MTKPSFFLLIALVLGASNPSASDFIDEANDIYVELRAMVEGDIAAASTEFSTLRSGVITKGQDTYTGGIISVSMTHEDTIRIVNQIKDAAQSIGVDITRCVEGPEEMINSLPNLANLELARCINGWIEGASNVISTAVSRVNGLTSGVLNFRFQIASCNRNILCVAPIVQEMELAMIRIPQEVDTEVLETTDRVKAIEVSIQTCYDATLSDYDIKLSIELDKVAACLA